MLLFLVGIVAFLLVHLLHILFVVVGILCCRIGLLVFLGIFLRIVMLLCLFLVLFVQILVLVQMVLLVLGTSILVLLFFRLVCM